MRLIDANALLEKVQFRLPGKSPYAEVIARCVDITRQLIVDSPTIDAVPVVRCEDCIYYEMRSCEQGYCYFWDREQRQKMNVVAFNDFCSYGERKDGDNNAADI